MIHRNNSLNQRILLVGWWVLGLILVFCSNPRKVQAQAWTQKQGTVYLKTSYGLTLAAEQLNFEGRSSAFYNEKPGYTFADSSFYLYTEGGIVDFLTLSMALPYKRLYNETLDHRKLTVGVGDMDIGLRFSIQEFARIPVISALAVNIGVTLPMNYTRNILPTLGRGQLALRATLNYGQSFYPHLPAYLQIGVGYQTRLPFYALTQVYQDKDGKPCPSGGDINCVPDQPDKVEAAHEFLFGVEFGIKAAPWILMQFYVNGTISFPNPTATLRPPGEIPPPTQRFIKAGSQVVFYPFYAFKWAENLGFGAQFMGTLFGQNTIKSADMQFGIEYKINFKELGQ